MRSSSSVPLEKRELIVNLCKHKLKTMGFEVGENSSRIFASIVLPSGKKKTIRKLGKSFSQWRYLVQDCKELIK